MSAEIEKVVLPEGVSVFLMRVFSGGVVVIPISPGTGFDISQIKLESQEVSFIGISQLSAENIPFGFKANSALTVLFWSMTKVQVVEVLEQVAPDQVINNESLSAVAVKVTEVPGVYASEQSAPQEIPVGFELISPLPTWILPWLPLPLVLLTLKRYVGVALTITCMSSLFIPPSLSVAVKRKVYIPAIVILENKGERVEPFVIVANDGVEPTWAQAIVLIIPGEVSLAEAPVGELVDVGKVIFLSDPAFATGRIFAQIELFQYVPAVQIVVTVDVANLIPLL